MRTLLILLMFCAPLTYAAELSVLPDRSSADIGSEFAMRVVFDAGEGSFNVIDGVLSVPEGIVVRRVSTAGSALPLWTEAPTYSRADRQIVFTGGSPAALTRGETLLFTVYADAKRAGTYTFESRESTAYLSDGTGLPVDARVQSEPIQVFSGGATSLVQANSRQNRHPLQAEIGSDPTLFNGKYFLSIFGGDTGSGVEYYEVKEGRADPVRSNGLYVLSDQSQRSRIQVTAVQNNGAREKIALNASPRWPVVLGCIALILVALGILRRRFRV